MLDKNSAVLVGYASFRDDGDDDDDGDQSEKPAAVTVEYAVEFFDDHNFFPFLCFFFSSPGLGTVLFPYILPIHLIYWLSPLSD